MIEFKTLNISNVLSYEKASVKFDNSIKRIYGLNRDANSEIGITGNGVGKSLLFSTLVNALYFHSPLSVVKAKTKEIISEKTRLSLSFSSNGKTKKIVQNTKGFTLFENFIDLETRTVPLAKEQIRKWFPLSEEEFFTTTFISSQRPYLLQQSTDLSRLELLSKLFQLNDYAKLKEVFSQKLRNVKDFEIKASVYKQQIKNKKQQLLEFAETDTSNLSKVESKALKIEQEVKQLETQVFDLESALKFLSSVSSIDEELSDIKKSYKSKLKPSIYLSKLENLKSLWEDYSLYVEELTAFKNKKQKLENEISGLKVDTTFKDDLDVKKEQLNKLSLELSKLESRESEYSSFKRKVSVIKNSLDDLGYSIKTVPTKDVAEEIALANSILKLEKLLIAGDCNCPTCNSELNLSEISKSIAKAKITLAKSNDILKAQKLLSALPDRIDFDYKDYSKKKIRLEILETQVLNLKSQEKDYSKYLEIKAKLDNLEKPLKIEKPEETFDPKQYELAVKVCDLLKTKKKLLSKTTLDENSTIDDIKAHFESEQTLLSKTTQSLADKKLIQSKLVAEISEIKMCIRSKTQIEEDLQAARKCLKQLLPDIQKKQIYTALVKTYSSKGLKIFVLQSISKLLQDNLNLYSSLVFSEDFSFAVETTDKGCSIKATRPNKTVSDVRNLSGAESNCFTLLCSLSLLPLLPNNRRTNLIILDEPLCNCDTTTRKKIIENFFPALHQVVTNIVFISNTPETVEDSKPFTVIKEGGKSSLVEGNLSPNL